MSGLKCGFWIDLVIFVIVIAALLIYKYCPPKKGCGIPILEWIIIFCVIFIAKGIANLCKIPVLRKCYRNRHTYTLTATIVFFALLLIWTVVGLVLYTSDSNNCSQISDTYGLNILMLILIIFGFIIVFFGLLMLCIIPCIYKCF